MKFVNNLLIVGMALLAFSCTKEDLPGETAGNSDKDARLGLSFNIVHAHNPHNLYGQYHNEACMAVVDDPAYQANPGPGTAINAIDNYLTNNLNFSGFSNTVNQFQSLFANTMQNLTYSSIRNQIDGYKGNNIITADAHEFAIDVIDYIETYDDVTLTHNDCQALIDGVKSREIAIANSSLIESEKEMLLIFTSVCKHSAGFWYEELTDPDAPGYGGNTAAAQGGSVPLWMAADGAGALTAVTSGASNWGFAVFGPWGYVGVTVGMAAFSSIINS